MHIEQRGLIYDATSRPPAERIAFLTGLCPLASGEMLASGFVGPAKHSTDGNIRLFRSGGDCSNWRALPARFPTELDGVPGSIAGGEMVETEPGRLLLFTTWFDRSDPDRPMFDAVTEGLWHSRLLYAVSTNNGETWSGWKIVHTPGLTGCAASGPVLRWPDGTIAVCFESYKEFDDPNPGRHGAWIVRSRDGARTFDAPCLIAQDPANRIYYWDERLCATGDNGLTALFWTHDLLEKRDLNVHMRTGRIEANEFVGGPVFDTGLPGQISAPCVLADGRVIGFVVDRGHPGTMTLWASRDGSRTWRPDEALIVHTHAEHAQLSQGAGKENVDFAEYWDDMKKWSFGHPAIRPLDRGRVLVAWYAGAPDCMSLHWAIVAV
ncbi:MAG: exo-alpha-sialidase [Planctomycetaceae bacterium]|nr:exo-alpha-sialidase [Planctomycetaceae bacterium]